MEAPIPTLSPQLLQDLFLLKRELVVAKVNAVFDGKLKELCLRTRFPKQVAGFVSACLAQRGELESGAGARCSFVADRAAWLQLCAADQRPNQILVADPELGFDAARSELLPLARAKDHAVIYALSNPRPDLAEIATLNEPKEFDVREVLKKHDFPPKDAERLATRSNGNVHLLTRMLTGTNDRPAWAAVDQGYYLRCLALIGGWNDDSEADRTILTELLGEPYDSWVQRVYPLTKKEEPPVVLEGKAFRPISRYESWQQLGHFLIDPDLKRFEAAAIKVLKEVSPELHLPKDQREFAAIRGHKSVYSGALRKGLADTLALLGALGKSLPTSPNLAEHTANEVIATVLDEADWKLWASLSSVLPQLAEAAPTRFLSAVHGALENLEKSPLKDVFGAYDNAIFGRNYHAGLLWSLELLAWSPDYLNRVAIALARLAQYPLPDNAGNNALATLRGIFLTWMPQTVATVEERRAAVQCVIDENPETGWKLLLAILPEGHQVGHYNQKPDWRDDWFPTDWSERVTRAEMHKQVENYADLAVQLAMNDVAKLIEIIGRWDHLPREIFQKVLDYLESPKALERPEPDRFALWQKLTDEIQRHRKYATADWAMPEAELTVLEKAANAIKPIKKAVLHQRLFNAHEHKFFTSSDYEAERRNLAAIRTAAVSEILEADGPGQILAMAKSVKIPEELGGTLGRIGTPDLDGFILPSLLDEGDRPLFSLLRGYIWARYFSATIDWARQLDTTRWAPGQLGLFFANLPFHRDVWQLAEQRLGGAAKGEYWERIWPNPYQAQGHIEEAAEKALANGRADLSVVCLNALLHEQKRVPTTLATAALKALIESPKPLRQFDHHDLIELIKAVQESPEADEGAVAWIEFQCLKLLDKFSGGSPVFLERQLANDPAFFHQVLTACFRSEQDTEKDKPIDEKQKQLAERTYPLLHNWRTPPGTTREKKIDEIAFAKWFENVRKLCEDSGHWAIGQQMIGKTLMYSPVGLAALLDLPLVAKILDAPENEQVRLGLRMELFNSRGVHGYTAGKEEKGIAAGYRERAGKFDLARYTRIAATLRSLAESYERDAERDAKRDPYAD